MIASFRSDLDEAIFIGGHLSRDHILRETLALRDVRFIQRLLKFTEVIKRVQRR